MADSIRRIRKKRSSWAFSKEQVADVTAIVLLVAGVLCSLLWLLDFTLVRLLVCLFGVLLSVAQWTFFCCFAEMIRIRKFENGLPYSGNISATPDSPLYACENCGTLLDSDSYCVKCGAAFHGDDLELIWHRKYEKRQAIAVFIA